VLYDLQKYHTKAWNVWIDHKQNHVRESIISNLKQGIEEGYFRSDINADILANARLELIQMTFDERVFSHTKYNLAEVNQQLFEHFIYGILTERGKKTYEKYKQVNQELIPN
jgi:TetR/AcrR family transcriptional regulator, cholesterol catabolism regulator